MISRTLPTVLLDATLAGVFLLASAGCASKQTQATTPPATGVGVTNAQPNDLASSTVPSEPVVPNSATACNVSISPEILQSCGRPETDAFFAFDPSGAGEPGRAALDAVAACFTTGPLAGRSIRLVGHAAAGADPTSDMRLGQARAVGVAEYLLYKDVPQGHVTATSRGSQDATGRDEAAQARDGRVDVLLGD